jgi:RNA polymerase sigma-70 factor (ECF subfamily)
MEDSPITRPSLLIRLRNPGDEAAWAEFTEIYGPLIHRLARRRGLQSADADDLTQDVFRNVAAAIDRWDPDPAKGSFRGWLFTIARNLTINFLSGRRQPEGTGDTGVADLLAAQPAPASEESALFEVEYRRQLFHWAAEQIRGGFSEAAWQAFWRTAVEGQGAKDVADALGMTFGTVYNCKSRVMARLRQKLEDVAADTAANSSPEP